MFGEFAAKLQKSRGVNPRFLVQVPPAFPLLSPKYHRAGIVTCVFEKSHLTSIVSDAASCILAVPCAMHAACPSVSASVWDLGLFYMCSNVIASSAATPPHVHMQTARQCNHRSPFLPRFITAIRKLSWPSRKTSAPCSGLHASLQRSQALLTIGTAAGHPVLHIHSHAVPEQGTLYPDVIESCPPPGSKRTHSHTIKSHHNVGGLPKDLNFQLVEPLKELFKVGASSPLYCPCCWQPSANSSV